MYKKIEKSPEDALPWLRRIFSQYYIIAEKKELTLPHLPQWAKASLESERCFHLCPDRWLGGGKEFITLWLIKPKPAQSLLHLAHLLLTLTLESKRVVAILDTSEFPRMAAGSLVNLGIPHAFVGRSLFAPALGMCLIELDENGGRAEARKLNAIAEGIASMKSKKSARPAKIRPTTAAIAIGLILALQSKEFDPLPTTQEALREMLRTQGLAVGVGTLSRALTELGLAQVAIWTKGGLRSPEGDPPEAQDLFERLFEARLDFLPPGAVTIPRQLFTPPETGFVRAGASALAHLSDLIPPPSEIFATSITNFRESGAEEAYSHWEHRDGFHPRQDASALIEVQIWDIDPVIFSFDGNIHPIWLALALDGKEDERVSEAVRTALASVGLSGDFIGAS